MIEGVDYSFARPSPSALYAAGKRFVCRYLSGGRSGKDITAAEANSLTAAGLAVVLVWESGGSRALDGHAAGVADANAAKAQAARVGQPTSSPIYFAVDFDPGAHLPAILDYFRGAHSVLAGRTGIYGGLAAVKTVMDAGLAPYAWQTYAWSGGRWDPRAQLQQYRNGVTFLGSAIDLDRATTPDFGGWGASPPVVIVPDPGADVALDGTDVQKVWNYYETADGKSLAEALQAIYAATVTNGGVDADAVTQAVTAALAAHPPTATVDPAPIAQAVLDGLAARLKA